MYYLRDAKIVLRKQIAAGSIPQASGQQVRLASSSLRGARRSYKGGRTTEAGEPLRTEDIEARKEISAAVRALDSGNDGTCGGGSSGFDGFDAPLGHALAEADPAEWTPWQTRAAYEILGRYRHRLAGAGIDYSAISDPPAEPEEVGERGSDWAGVEDGNFVVGFGRLAPTLITEVQKIPGSRFDSRTKTAAIPASPAAVEPLVSFIVRHRLDFSPGLVELVDEVGREREERIEASRAADAKVEVEDLGGDLRPFQRAGVAYALRTRRTLIADQMGLGKTVEALAAVQAAGEYPALVVCPASLKLNWAREAGRWLPGRSVEILDGGVTVGDVEITIVNYDVLVRHVDALVDRGFRALIVDESHYVKNEQAKRTRLCMRLSRGVPMRLLLSGTPMTGRPEELVSQLKILDRLDEMGGYRHFMHRYAGAYRNWHERHSGEGRKGEPRNLEELNRKLRATCYVRRTKEAVLAELPAKQRAVVPVELDNRREYERVFKDVVRFLGEAAENDRRRMAEAVEQHKSRTGAEPDAEAMNHIRSRVRASAEARAERARQLVEIETLKSTAARGKLAAIVGWIETFIESGEKLVVFAWHREIAETLAERFGAPRITGEMSARDRQEAVDLFQGDPDTRLLVANIRAGGVGLTLTAASNVAFAELAWTPAEHEQAEDRCHRIGQADSVTAWYLLAENTIDTRIYALLENKRAVVDAATEGLAEVAGGDVLSELRESLEEKPRTDEE